MPAILVIRTIPVKIISEISSPQQLSIIIIITINPPGTIGPCGSVTRTKRADARQTVPGLHKQQVTLGNRVGVDDDQPARPSRP